MPLHTCHRHSSSTDRPPAQQLKQQQQHGAWEQQLQLCDTEEGCTGCRVCEGTLSRPKSRKLVFDIKTLAKESPAARNVVTHLLIPYRRRRCAAGRNPTPHGRTCGAAPTLRAGPNPAPPPEFSHPRLRSPHLPCPLQRLPGPLRHHRGVFPVETRPGVTQGPASMRCRRVSSLRSYPVPIFPRTFRC